MKSVLITGAGTGFGHGAAVSFVPPDTLAR